MKKITLILLAIFLFSIPTINAQVNDDDEATAFRLKRKYPDERSAIVSDIEEYDFDIGKGDDGRVFIQTRQPDHPVVKAAVLGDPSRVMAGQLALRQLLGFPPTKAVAAISGAGAEVVAGTVRSLEPTIRVEGPAGGPYLLKAPTQAVLCGVLAKVERPAERVRVEVDPLRI